MWKVKKILEGDYGCEERMPGEPKNAIVYLINDEGIETNVLIDDDWLYENDIVEGCVWPEPLTVIIHDGDMRDECDDEMIKKGKNILLSLGLEADKEQ